MKNTLLVVLLVFGVSASLVYAGPLDDILKGARLPGAALTGAKAEPDRTTTVSGLKEALSIGTEKAVKSVSKTDGYFKNQLIKILLPEKLQQVADILGRMGFQKQVDSLVLSMNRAAEAAAPKATALFVQAVKEMTFEDAVKILRGNDTAATEYFKGKTSGKLFREFKPVVTANMNKVGVVKAYKNMMAPAESLPFLSKESVDLDHYVTTKALDGLFTMVGEEEKKIRTNPAARVTTLLKTVFGK
jgi:hypothetical protein